MRPRCGMVKGSVVLLVGLLAAPLATLFASPPIARAGQFAIVLQAGKEGHEGTARAVHALLYAKELKERGHDVVLIFDGAGTEWAEELSNPESDSGLKGAYEELRAAGVVEAICDFCAAAFGVKDRLAERHRPLLAEYAGHPSIAKWVDKGYQLIIL